MVSATGSRLLHQNPSSPNDKGLPLKSCRTPWPHAAEQHEIAQHDGVQDAASGGGRHSVRPAGPRTAR